MAESSTRQAASSSRQEASNDWESLAPVAVDYEDALGPNKVAAIWNDMYSRAKLRAPSEQIQKAFRLAVYVYAAKNGTSREGDYTGEITMSNGHTFPASVIVLATTKMNIRKFFRGTMLESYEALKESKALERDDRFVAKVAKLGITPACAFATADWFSDCPSFTPLEKAAYEASFYASISRSRRNRGGRNLEEVEAERIDKGLEVQGSAEPPSHSEGRVSF